MENAADFKRRLLGNGLSAKIVEAAWPEWWSEDADASASARTELRFSVARKLGLDPRTLLDDREPRWIWEDAARFKSFRGDVRGHQPAISSFGMALGRMLLSAMPPPDYEADGTVTAARLRETVLGYARTVGLPELLLVSWGLGIPVIHLRAYPLSAKKMSAMSVCVDGRYVIFLAKEGTYPAPSAFYLAHELGHIFLGHLASGQSIVDLGGLGDPDDEPDDEERAADAFAMELLTGDPKPQFQIAGGGRSSRELARQALQRMDEYRIEPGTLALTYGHFTGHWDTAMGALQRIYDRPLPVWQVVNSIAQRHIAWSQLEDESESYLRAVMGGISG
jgi:hypothetical protein